MYVGFCQSVAWARLGCKFNATLQIECDPVVLRERRVLSDIKVLSVKSVKSSKRQQEQI